MLNCLYVGLGGFIGSVFRYLIGSSFPSVTAHFPFCTLMINFLGSALIGAVTILSHRVIPLDPKLMLMLTVGVCGGFTTFSTFSLEVMNLLEKGKLLLAGSYAALSILICLFGVYLGRTLVLLLARY